MIDELIQQAQAAGLTTVYFYASRMVADGRRPMLIFDGTLPQVNINPASVDALRAACEAAGIECVALTPEMAGLK